MFLPDLNKVLSLPLSSINEPFKPMLRYIRANYHQKPVIVEQIQADEPMRH